jgi:predicted dehydrogenase
MEERRMVRIAVIGAGQWGPNLIRHFDNRHTSRVAWVIDRDPDRLDQVRVRFPDIRLGEDPTTALDDPDVDAAVIATPTSTHFDLAIRAIERGKHVLVEKPITASIREGELLCEAAERQGVVLMVGHVFLYNAGVERVKRYLDDRALGRVYYISMVRTNLGPIRVDVNAAWDLASHDISIANYWLDSPPESVSAVGGTWVNSGLEDAVFATLRYPENVLVNLHVSWLNPRKARDITIVGEHKMITLDDLSLAEPIRIFDKGVADERVSPAFIDSFASFRASVREGDITIPHVPLDEPLRAECEHFVTCVAEGTPPRTDGRLGLSVVSTLDALARSIENGGGAVPVGEVEEVA